MPLTQLNGQCQLDREKRAETAAPVTSWVRVTTEATDRVEEGGPLLPDCRAGRKTVAQAGGVAPGAGIFCGL